MSTCIIVMDFTAHVIGFTTAAVLGALTQRCDVHGHLDSSVPLVLPLIEADLFGHVAEAKEAANFASNYKEAKRCRAYEAYQLLAASVSFSPASMEGILAPVRERLPAASGPTVRAKLQQLLQHAARGVAANPTAGGEGLADFLSSLLLGCVKREEAARARAKEAVAAATSVAPKGASFWVGRGGKGYCIRLRSLKLTLAGLQGLMTKGACAYHFTKLCKRLTNSAMTLPRPLATVNAPPRADRTAPQSAEERAALHEHLLIEFGLTVLQASRPSRLLAEYCLTWKGVASFCFILPQQSKNRPAIIQLPL